MSQPPSPLAADAVELTAAGFEARIAKHEDFVQRRVGGRRSLRRHLTARGMRCDKRQLTEIDFTGWDVEGTTFIGTNLDRASLYCANLSKCDMTAASLKRADMRGARLLGATLRNAVLDEADLRSGLLAVQDTVNGIRVVAGTASVEGSRMDGVNLSDAVANSVDFTDCTMVGVKMRGANLKGANFTNANMTNADLLGARLEGATFEGAVLAGVPVDKLGLSREQLKGCLLDPDREAVLLGEHLTRMIAAMDQWARTGGKAGAPVVIDERDLRTVKGLDGKALPGISARRVVAVGVNFQGATLAGANFEGADLRNANFQNADLRGVNFKDANLTHAKLGGADLSPLELVNGQVRPTLLEGARVAGTGLRPVPPRPTPPEPGVEKEEQAA